MKRSILFCLFLFISLIGYSQTPIVLNSPKIYADNTCNCVVIETTNYKVSLSQNDLGTIEDDGSFVYLTFKTSKGTNQTLKLAPTATYNSSGVIYGSTTTLLRAALWSERNKVFGFSTRLKPGVPTSGFRFYSDSTGNPTFLTTSGYTNTFQFPTYTVNRRIIFPDADVDLSNLGGGGSYIPLAGTSALAGNIVPSTDNTISIGSTTNKVLLQASTLGFGTTPTHSITVPSVGTGYSHYNTVDQLTNYERFRSYWSGNIYNITTEKGGSGTVRGIFLNFASTGFYVSNSAAASGMMRVTTGNQAGAGSLFGVIGTLTSTSTTQNGVVISPAFNQSSTANANGLLISPYIITTGASTYLLNVGTNTAYDNGGTHTRLFSVSNTGLVTLSNIESVTDGVGALGQQSKSFANSYVIATNTEFIRERYSNSNLTFRQFNNTIVGTMFGATGNWFFGPSPSDATYRLDVNGTTRLQGAITLTGQTVSAASATPSTNKIQININGTTYYLLATTEP